MQKTIVLNYNGQQIVSQPFTLKHACIIDDERFRGGGLASGSRLALQKMFEGTVATDEVIDNLGRKTAKECIDKIIDWHLGIDEEVKNS
jgi:hypothetical protein